MTTKLPIPIVNTIKKRKSIRTYEPRPLSKEDKEKLMAYKESVSNPFGVRIRIHYLEKSVSNKEEKLGTYGFIKGASSFLGVSVQNVENAMLAVGYEFENLVLCLTDMGLGTVWMALTFNRKGFESAMDIQPDELFPIISPVGYPAKQRLQETLIRKTMGSSSRQPWSKLFFNVNFSTPLTEKEADKYATPLEMVRLAPSAKNAQPWRVLKENNRYHFFETHKPNDSQEEVLIKHVDLGIALSHFHQTALELGLKGSFKKLSPKKENLPANYYYCVSWIAE